MKSSACGSGKSFFGPGRAPVLAAHAAVATSHPLAAAEALSVLKNNGSAADAAITAAAMLCVAEPHMTGIGGDAFALAGFRKTNNGTETPVALDGSGWLPAGFSLSQGDSGIGETSPLSVTVPGAIAAWEKLHQRFGKVPWKELLAPAVAAARIGIPVAPRVARDWKNESARVQSDPDAAALYLPDGKAPNIGDLHRNPKLADALESVAQDGARAFYVGDIAHDIVGKLNSLGASHSASDFAEYLQDGAQWRTPVATDYRGWKVWECPPAGQGLAALLMLRAMREHDFAAMNESERAKVFASICRRAYQWRDENIGDNAPAGNLNEVLENAARECFPKPGPESESESQVQPRRRGAEHRDTVCVVAMDADGLAVSLLNSLFHPFGSGIVAPQSGTLLHNRGASFSPNPRSPNTPSPRKRPLHTLIPALAENANGDALAFGVMGGQYQAAGHAWFLTNLLDLQVDLQSALDAPRMFCYPPESDALQLEPGFAETTRKALCDAGWKLATAESPMGGGQAALRFADGTLAAASDPRKDGVALGF